MIDEENGFVCPVCGCRDYVPSTITLMANYGSAHDGAVITVGLCGKCFDRMAGMVGAFSSAMSESGMTKPCPTV